MIYLAGPKNFVLPAHWDESTFECNAADRPRRNTLRPDKYAYSMSEYKCQEVDKQKT